MRAYAQRISQDVGGLAATILGGIDFFLDEGTKKFKTLFDICMSCGYNIFGTRAFSIGGERPFYEQGTERHIRWQAHKDVFCQHG